MKFGAELFTDNCTKQLEEPAKCANCGGNHTANYKGCQTFKKILNRIKFKTKTTKRDNQHTQTQAVPPAPHRSGHDTLRSNPREKPSYAEVTANTPPSDQLQIVTSFLNKLKLILNPLLTALTSLINKFPLLITSNP